MERKTNLGISALFSCSFAAFLVNSHYLGFIIEGIDTDGVIWLAIMTILYPLLVLFIANTNEVAKKVCLFVCAIAAVVGSYFVLLRADNFRLPTLELDMLTLLMYFLMLGSTICLTMISFAEIMRTSRKTSNHSLFFGGNLLMVGVVVGIAVAIGRFGWLIPLMLNDYTVPAGIMLYFLWYPSDTGEVEELSKLHKPRNISEFSIRDSSKGFKLTVYTILSAFQIALLLAGNGLAIVPPDFYLINWVFWIFVGVGSFAMMALFKVKFARVDGLKGSLEKRKKSQVDWILVSLIQLVVFVVAVILEFYLSNFHGSLYSHVVTGLFLGITISGFLKQVAIQHAPRSMYLYLMFFCLMMAYAIIAGSYLKALSVDMTAFNEEVAPYAVYLVAIICITWILLLLPLLRTTRIHKIKPIRLNKYQARKQKRSALEPSEGNRTKGI
ncbi:MAG: hypothetical protein ACTSUE_10700 [Promethearchaeota archaeon]